MNPDNVVSRLPPPRPILEAKQDMSIWISIGNFLRTLLSHPRGKNTEAREPVEFIQYRVQKPHALIVNVFAHDFRTMIIEPSLSTASPLLLSEYLFEPFVCSNSLITWNEPGLIEKEHDA